jgi:hypothetical protein
VRSSRPEPEPTLSRVRSSPPARVSVMRVTAEGSPSSVLSVSKMEMPDFSFAAGSSSSMWPEPP